MPYSCANPISKGELNDEKAYFASLAAHCNKFKGADNRRALWQISSTLALFALALGGMFYAAAASNWLLYAGLLLPTAGLLVRLFIIQHDCGHNSYFSSRALNDWTGRALSVLTWTPYHFWRRTHNMHHASSGNLDKRGYGSIDTITVEEFRSLSPGRRLAYRLYRNVFLLLGLGTPLFVIVVQRFWMTEPFMPEFASKAQMKGAWKGIMTTNICLAVIFGGAGYFIGFGLLAAVYLPVLILTAQIGGWLFYIQHQFENTFWARKENWNFNEAAVMSSSYYDLPKLFQWFSGNIGLHHIHHLNMTVPNYKLQECLESHPDLPNINRMTFLDCLKTLKLALWCENQKRLVSFREINFEGREFPGELPGTQ